MTVMVLQLLELYQLLSASVTVETAPSTRAHCNWPLLIKIATISGHVSAPLFSVGIPVKLMREDVGSIACVQVLCASMTAAKHRAMSVETVFMVMAGAKMEKSAQVNCMPSLIYI